MSTFDDRETDDRPGREEGWCRSELGSCAEEVPRTEWKAFLDEFSRLHAEDEVSVEIRGETSGGAHWLSQQTPLLGLVASDEDEPGSIEVILGTLESGPLTHIVHNAQRVWQQRDGRGREMLQITSEDGTSAIITVLSRREQGVM
jgi:hypothetical protein